MKYAGYYTPSSSTLYSSRWAERTGDEDSSHKYKIYLFQGTTPVEDPIDLLGTQVQPVPDTHTVTSGVPVKVYYEADTGDGYDDPQHAGNAAVGGGKRFWAESDTETQYQDYNDANILLSG